MRNRKRDKQIVIRMSEPELARLKDKVSQSGLTQQEYIIRCITGKKITNLDRVKEVLPELNRIGNNLNQIAKRCNTGDEVSAAELTHMREELSEVWQLLNQLIAKQA